MANGREQIVFPLGLGLTFFVLALLSGQLLDQVIWGKAEGDACRLKVMRL